MKAINKNQLEFHIHVYTFDKRYDKNKNPVNLDKYQVYLVISVF